MSIKCACKIKDCPVEIVFLDKHLIELTDKDGNYTTMYLDANTIVQFISELRECLLKMAGSEDG